ncbi:hypothetical protein DV735_g78, partial [Chaetothyriales sp. CBS 134920]
MALTINGTGSKKHLRVLVVGAGIAGLTAAIGLRRQGHEVEIFEQSRFARETGAAVHVQPNANGILKRLGVSESDIEANKMEKLTEYSSTGELQRTLDLNEPNKIWQHDWRLAHRIRLHETLKRLATEKDGEGTPATLHLSSSVVSVDPENGSLTLEDGTVVSGDVVLGADGVHSRTRSYISSREVKPYSSGKSAFRFLIDRKSALESPSLAKYLQTPGELVIWYGRDRRVVMYPTSNNTLLNFVCIHPEEESEDGGGQGWSKTSTKEALLRVYKGFDPGCLELLGRADAESLKLWTLLDMPVLDSWVNGRLALLGDSAHPFLPHQGQGAGVAMEDAAAIGVVLERGLSRDQVPDRLKLYQDIRYERANRIQEYSRLMGKDIQDAKGINMIEYTNYNFGHDEFDNSTQRLREWKWSRRPDLYWRMPVAFGPMPGPRQSHDGKVRDSVESTFRTASIKFKSSRTVLQNLFPPGVKGYRFKSPGTVAYASFSCTTLNRMEWLGGTGYNHIGLYIHGVEFERADGSVLNGAYMPILFESLTDPIVSGREELGMPKLYTAIDVFHGAESLRINTSWQGSLWGNFRLDGLKEDTNVGAATGKITGGDDDGVLVYRYMPRVGRDFKGQSEAEYPVFVPFAEERPQPVTKRVWRASSASFSIDALDWDALPTLHHIIARLQEIPVYEIVNAQVVEGIGVPDVAVARRVS